MSKQSAELIQGLWPLPGGNNRYLHTLDQVIQWVAGTPEPTREKLTEWFMAQYNVGKGSISGYLQVIFKLGVFDLSENSKIAVSKFGQDIINAEGQAKARLVIDRFMYSYLAFPQVLAVYASAKQPIHLNTVVETLQPQFTQWTSEAQFGFRALWLLSCGCLHQVKGRAYSITEFGSAIAKEYALAVPHPTLPTVENEVISRPHLIQELSGLEQLITELKFAGTDSGLPQKLERLIAQAFEFLGFTVHQLGVPGETDVLAQANIGPESYQVIIDAKSRRNGKLQDLEVYTLREHMGKNAANYAVVVATDFADGKVSRHAKENGIVLLTIDLLGKWLRLHAATPLNLAEYQAMFESPGLLSELPTSIKSAAEQRKHWGRLLIDLIELIQETYTHGLTQALPANQLFTMLVTRLRGVRYAEKEINQAIQLLAHPAIVGVMGDPVQGISLAMNRDVLVRALRALADQIAMSQPEIEE